MRKPTFLLALLLTALLLLVPCTTPPLAWTDPILVTPDSASSIHSRAVIDRDGNIHFFYLSDRYEVSPENQWDIFHCKFSPHGVRLTEDLRIDSTQSLFWCYPSPLLGDDNKIHVAWGDNLDYPWNVNNGIYYARLTTEGEIEFPATRVIEHYAPIDVHLFQDSQGDLNCVWLSSIDSLFYAKFDTQGQVLIQPVFVTTSTSALGDLWYMTACIDNQDQIHCVYKNYWGIWLEFNLGYSRVNNQGDVLIPYYPLTPELTSSCSPLGYIAADHSDNLHLLYLLGEDGYNYQRYRKMDQDLNTVYDYQFGEYTLMSTQIGTGDVVIDGDGNIMLAWRDNQTGGIEQYRRVVYSPNGEVILPSEMIVEQEGMSWPDLAVHPNGMAVFNYSGGEDYPPNNGIFYLNTMDTLGILSGHPCPETTSLEISVFPNPFNANTNITIMTDKGGDAHIKVIDIMGKTVMDYGTLHLQERRSLMLNYPLSSGVYYLLIRNGINSAVQPLVYVQ